MAKRLIAVVLFVFVVGCSNNHVNEGYNKISIIDESTMLTDDDLINVDEQLTLQVLEEKAEDIVVVKALNTVNDKNSINPNNNFESIEEMVNEYEEASTLAYFMSKVEVISTSKGDLKPGDVIEVMYNVFVEKNTISVPGFDLEVPLNEGETGVMFIAKNTDEDLKQDYINMARKRGIAYNEDDFYYTAVNHYGTVSFHLEDNITKTTLVHQIIEKYNK